MSLRHYIQVLRRRWWILLLGPLVAGTLAYFFSESQPDMYRARTTILVNHTQTPGVIQYNDILASQRLTNTYAQLVRQRPVLRSVIEALDLPYGEGELKSKVQATPVTDTQLIKISVHDVQPALASSIANTLAQKFIESNSTDLGRFGTVSITEPATVPTHRAKPRVLMNTAVAVVFGLLVAGGIILLLENLDDTVKSADGLGGAELSSLAVISRFKNGWVDKGQPDSRPVTLQPGYLRTMEEYRILRTSISATAARHSLRVLLVASGRALEGKSTTAVNLAVVMGQAGRRTILMDSDLRFPIIHRCFGIPNEAGLTSILVNESQNVEDVLVETSVKNLYVVPSGPLPQNAAELLASGQMLNTMRQVRELADVVILDSPPLHTTADASVLAGHSDVVLLVVESGKTRIREVRRSLEMLSRSNANVIGAVLNKSSERRQTHPQSYVQESLNHNSAPPGTRILS